MARKTQNKKDLEVNTSSNLEVKKDEEQVIDQEKDKQLLEEERISKIVHYHHSHGYECFVKDGKVHTKFIPPHMRGPGFEKNFLDSGIAKTENNTKEKKRL